jgi:hypothetical protein
MPGQLRCRDLAAGDILLKVNDGSLVAGAIQLGQALRGGDNPSIVHAGVLFDSTFIIEAQGHGISANDLRVQNRDYGYHVFRCLHPNMAAGAGTCAKMMFDIHHSGNALGYSITGAIGSLFGRRGRAATPTQMDQLLDRVLAGRQHRFFCSQFVVYVYQFVAEQNGIPAGRIFNVADAKVPPSLLAADLANHSSFAEVGYLMAGAR